MTPDEFLSEKRRAKWYLGGLVAGVGLLAFALSMFATSGDVRAVEERAAKLEARAQENDQWRGKADSFIQDLMSERDFVRKQLWEIARSVGAPQLQPPVKR